MLVVFGAVSDFDTDCDSYNPSSMLTTCWDVDICCNDSDCWYQLEDGTTTEDPDLVLDQICVWDSAMEGPLIFTVFIGMDQLWVGPWEAYPTAN